MSTPSTRQYSVPLGSEVSAHACAVSVSKSATGLVKAGLAATWSCEDRPAGVCHRKMTTWPAAKLAPCAGASSVGGGCRVIFTETVSARQVAVRTTGVLVVTCRVVIVKLTSWPAAVTLAGTDAAGELLAMVITLPLGAFPLNSSVPTTSVPPEKKLGRDLPSSCWLDSMNTWFRLAGSTVSGAVTAWPPSVALRVSGARAGDLQRLDREAPLRLPGGDLGLTAELPPPSGLLLARAMVAPPDGRGW